ncbi:MAG: glycosyltransferase [Lachnospiraceae bacterium]|nr:glycosyltransferase [Lachnospiraceae bacterium]
MRLQMLISGMNLDTTHVAENMKLEADAIVINQTDSFGFEEYQYNNRNIRVYSFIEKGVGLSRNNALLRADGDIVLFSDEDIVYNEGYAKAVLDAFEANPDIDMIFFNFDVAEDRQTYHIEKKGRIRSYNCGRYPTYSLAVRREVLHKKGITFSLLFGGGAKYSNGEDSLFIKQCIKSGMKALALPVTLGREVPRPSTWFNGYTDKFFYDRGVLYKALYKGLAKPLALRFLIAHRDIMLTNRKLMDAYKLMTQGMKEF